MSLLISVNCPNTQWQLCPMPTLLYRQEPHQWELLRIEVATAAVPSARWTYYNTMRCQLTNESAGSSWHFGWNQPFQGWLIHHLQIMSQMAFQPRTKSPTALILAYGACQTLAAPAISGHRPGTPTLSIGWSFSLGEIGYCFLLLSHSAIWSSVRCMYVIVHPN